MIVRHIEQQEKEHFIQFSVRPGEQNWIKQLFEEQETRPEWCFVIEDNGKSLGSVVYFQFEGNDAEMNIVELTLPWEGNYEEIGEQLLNESMGQITTYAIKKLEFRCDTYDTDHQEKRTVIENVGFQLTQEKHRYILTDLDLAYDDSRQLVFKTLDDVGEAQFIEAIRRVTINTLDRADQKEIDIFGAEEAASAYFNTLKSIDDTPDHWLLAYDPNDHLIGLVVAQQLSERSGCINYIGVVPEYRGKHYSKALAIKASEVLQKIPSIERIIADIDTANFPLEHTLAALQYQTSITLWIYHKHV